jgi:hypothetical protein
MCLRRPLGKKGLCPKCQQKFLVQVSTPLDEFDPVEESLDPLDDLDSPAQPLPQRAAKSRGRAKALPSQAAAPVAKGKKKPKAESAGLGNRQKIMLVGGGIILSLVLLVFVIVRIRGGGSSASGQYAVVDSLPSPPAEPVEPPAPPLDVEKGPAAANTAWSVKPDPPSAEEKPPAEVVGALSPEQSLLLASLGGPFAVGVTLGPQNSRRDKILKRADGSPGEVISIDKEPYPVLDIRTGKPVGRFPVDAHIRFNCRLSPDGRFLASSATEFKLVGDARRIAKDELIVWQRDADQPICRWPLPGPVLWTDFIGPDRLALYHATPGPQFVVLDVTKGTPVVTSPLPGEEFSAQHDAFKARKDYTSYRVWTPSGAVSPGRKWIALGGNKSIVLVDTAGRVAGKLPIDPVSVVRGYLGVSFSYDGTQLRALTQQGEAAPVLRVWSLVDGQPLHKTTCPFQLRAGENPYQESAPGPAILDGPEPNTLVVGHQLFDLTSDQKVAELPYQPLRWAGPKRLLALGSLEQAANTKQLGETADFVPRGSSLIVAAFDGAALMANAPKPAPAVAGKTSAQPAAVRADRSNITAIRLKPPAAWTVKPGAQAPRPAGPLPLWPHAFADTEAAVITESLSWNRYDLNTGNTIGEPIDLWPGQPRSSERVEHTAALTRNGQRIALIDSKDRARVDVWDVTGKRLIGLRPYENDPVLWLGWSSDGKLLTADGAHLSGWDVETGQAAFEVEGKFKWFATAPGAEWVMAMTPARHLFFVDAATGQCLGHIPASPTFPEHTLSPDGKTLVRLGEWLNVQVWDLQTGKRKSDRETPLVPISLAIGGTGLEGMRLGVFWIDTRSVISHTKSPAEQQLRYYLYDFDAHTHTYSYAASLGTFQNDALGRAWMTSRAGLSETWIAPNVPGSGAFNQTLAFGPGTTVRVEVNVGARANSQKTAKMMADALHSRGFKIGRDGWVLRADHTIRETGTDLKDDRGQRGITVATLNITWRLLDPEGKEAWKGTSGGKFDPFQSQYVVLGSRKTDMAPGGMGGGSTQVRLDYKGKDPMTAQVEEILEKYWFPGVPNCLVKKEDGYVALPLEAKP